MEIVEIRYYGEVLFASPTGDDEFSVCEVAQPSSCRVLANAARYETGPDLGPVKINARWMRLLSVVPTQPHRYTIRAGEHPGFLPTIQLRTMPFALLFTSSDVTIRKIDLLLDD